MVTPDQEEARWVRIDRPWRDEFAKAVSVRRQETLCWKPLAALVAAWDAAPPAEFGGVQYVRDLEAERDQARRERDQATEALCEIVGHPTHAERIATDALKRWEAD